MYPDPMQRVVLGWPIRWAAGLFSLLMVVAGAVPALASDDVEASRWTDSQGLYATADGHQIHTVEITPSTTDLLGAKTLAESEGEKAEEADSSPSPLGADSISDRDIASRIARHEYRWPRRTEPSSRLAPRAPPIA